MPDQICIHRMNLEVLSPSLAGDGPSLRIHRMNLEVLSPVPSGAADNIRIHRMNLEILSPVAAMRRVPKFFTYLLD